MYKRVIAILAAALLALGVAATSAAEDGEGTSDEPTSTVNQTQVNQVRADVSGKAPIRELTATDEKIAETSTLALYLDRAAFGIKVLNKQSGYVWRSILPDDELHNMSANWQRFAQSMLVGDFILSQSGVSRQVPLKDDKAEQPVITLMENGFRARVNFFETKAYCDIVVTLTESGLSVEVPRDSIECAEGYVLSALYIMPFLGASYSDEIPGYLFVPDGSGALIRFGKPRASVSPYTGRIYGPDYGVKEQTKLGLSAENAVPRMEDEQVLLPVFGIAHGGNQDAFLAVVADGDSSCEVVASSAGTVIDFFWASPRFVFQETYWQPTSNAGGFNMLQPEENGINTRMEYYFLNGGSANYTGMAVRYRDLLLEQGGLSRNNQTGDIPIKLDAVLAERASGFWGDVTKCLTTVQDVSGWVDELERRSVKNIQMALVGFEPQGISGHDLGSYQLEGKAGNEKQLQQLWSQLQSVGGRLTLQTDITGGYGHQIGSKFYKTMISRQPISTAEVHPLYQTRYYADEETLSRLTDRLSGLPEYKKAFALDGIGRQLYSDNLSGSYQLRPAVLDSRMKILAAAAEKTDYLMLESPNQYAYRFADGVYNVPTTNSRLIYETDAVPFLQTLLSGCVDTFAGYLNFGGGAENLLTLVDYGTYPSFVLSQVYSSEFSDTNSSYIYSSRFEDWKEDIAADYAYVNRYLSPVRGSSVAARSVPQDGVSVTAYSNGRSIVVNYTDAAITYQGTTVAAQSAELI